MVYISKDKFNHIYFKPNKGAGGQTGSCVRVYDQTRVFAGTADKKSTDCITPAHSHKAALKALAAAAFSVILALSAPEAFPLNAYAENVTIESDEYGVAYVLKEDGTRDYNNVPALPTTDENAVSERTIIDSNRHDLGLNGPTKDQSLAGIPDGMTKETYEALSDSVINFDEIPDIIRYKNPTYTKYYNQADASLTTMRQGYDDFSRQMEEQLKTIDDTIDNLKESEEIISKLPGNTVSLNGTTSSKDAALESLSKGLDNAKSGKRSITSALTSTKSTLFYAGQQVDTALKPVKNQLIATVESLIVSYKTLEANRSLVAEQVALYESLYSTYKDMEAQSLSTSTVTAAYLNQLNTARKTLAEVDAGLNQLKKNILVQCGYDADADVTIADIPAADRSFLEGRDKAADKKLAVDGNSAVTSAGNLGNYTYSSDGMKSRALGENEARGKAGAAFDALYNEVQRQLILQDSADTSLRKAELTEQSGKLKYELGMLSRAEYAALQLQAASYRANARTAGLNLTQAVNNYCWAMDGIMNIE